MAGVVFFLSGGLVGREGAEGLGRLGRRLPPQHPTPAGGAGCVWFSEARGRARPKYQDFILVTK